MKKSLFLLAFPFLCAVAAAQNNIHVDVCTKFWPAAQPVTACTITATVSAPGFTTQTTEVVLDSTQSCAGFDFDTNQYPADAEFSFSAHKDQDDPLNGVNMFDLVLMSKHILGLEPLPTPLAMVAADANSSNSITTFDMVEERKLILGTYSNWPNAPVWQFFADYQMPFQNPINPFQGTMGSSFLTLAQMQALNGGTIVLTGAKTGDVDGDANALHNFGGTWADSLALTVPNLSLVAGVPTLVPISISGIDQLAGMQFEIKAVPGSIVFDTLTVDPMFNNYFYVNITDPAQKSQIRALMFDPQNTLSESPVMYLRLTANANTTVKEAIQIQQAGFYPLGVGDDAEAYNLYLDFANTTNTQSLAEQDFEVVAVSPNPFADQAQVRIALNAQETVLLELMDSSGKLLFSEKYSLGAGEHSLQLPTASLPNEGVILYRISAGSGAVSGKLLRRK